MRFLPLLTGSLFILASLQPAPAQDSENVRDFEKDQNVLSPGHWAYGWFGRDTVNGSKSLTLFRGSYPEDRVGGMPNWTADPNKKEVCWTIGADGRTYVDGAEVAWIYQVPAQLAGSLHITGELNGGGSERRIRIYKISDETFSGEDRATLKPLFEAVGANSVLDAKVDARENELLLFVINDTAAAPQYWNPSLLQVRIEKAP